MHSVFEMPTVQIIVSISTAEQTIRRTSHSLLKCIQKFKCQMQMSYEFFIADSRIFELLSIRIIRRLMLNK